MKRLVRSLALQHVSYVWCEKYVKEKVNNRIQREIIKWVDSCYANAVAYR